MEGSRYAVDASTQSISLPGPPHGGQHTLVSQSTFNSTRDAIERRREPRDDGMLVRRRVRRRQNDDTSTRSINTTGRGEGARVVVQTLDLAADALPPFCRLGRGRKHRDDPPDLSR